VEEKFGADTLMRAMWVLLLMGFWGCSSGQLMMERYYSCALFQPLWLAAGQGCDYAGGTANKPYVEEVTNYVYSMYYLLIVARITHPV
jgi:hypothetical protein